MIIFNMMDLYHIVGVVDDDDENSQAKSMMVEFQNPNEYAICNCCGARVRAKTKTGWTNASMQPHLLGHGVSKVSEDERKQQEAELKSSIAPKRKQLNLHESFTKSSHKKIKTSSQLRAEQLEATAVWIATTNQPLSAVENPSFRDMIASISPTMKPITSMNVKENIMDWVMHSLPIGMFLHKGGSKANELLDHFLTTGSFLDYGGKRSIRRSNHIFCNH